MSRKISESTLVIASHNPGKVREIADLLAPFDVEVVSASEMGLDEPVEDGLTFAANAEIKARAGTEGSGLPVLADDSGLSVDALDGAPGIYSARWAGPNKDFDLAMQKVEDEVGDATNRRAHFVCALTLAWPDGHMETFEGRFDGSLVWPPRGDKGFGYDPIFQPDGMDVTCAEMPPEEKHRISHRAQAFKLLVAACFK